MPPSHDPTYPLFPILSFLGFVLSAIPFAWHLEAWNSGTCAFMIWTSMACLNGFINSLIWKGNVSNPAPIWCDISSKFMVGASIGIPAATLCISRRLYLLTSTTSVSITRADKRRMVITDICISFGIPSVIMALHYIVQGHRFDILEDIGCYPVIYNTLVAYFIYVAWPVILGIISFVFSCLTLRSFWIRRAQFSQLVTSNSSMSMSRYLRLMVLAMCDIVCTLPLTAYVIYGATNGVGLQPWISWEETHYDFARVVIIPSKFWRKHPALASSAESTRWLPVVCALLFFALFGFASEAQRQYKRVFWAVLKPFGLRPSQAKPTVKAALPSWVKPLKTSNISAPIPSSFTHSRSDKTFGSSLITNHTDLELGTCIGSDAGKSYNRSSASLASAYTAPPPAYDPERPVPRHLPLDVEIDQEAAFPPSPFSESHTIVGSEFSPKKFDDIYSSYPYSPAKPPRAKQSVSSLESVSTVPRDRFYVVQGDRENAASPPPFSTVFGAGHPGFHRPFSPPATYPTTLPHPTALQEVDGIRVTVHTHTQSCESLRNTLNNSSAR